MLLHEILTEFQNRIEDANYWDDTRGTTLANQAQRDIAARFGSSQLQAYTTLTTVVDQQRYLLPSDYIANRYMYYDSGNNQKITLVDAPDDIYGKVSDAESTTGKPTHGFMWVVDGVENIWLYPIPDDEYTIQWWYYRTPTKMANDNDRPLLDLEFHQYIVDFMEARAKVQDGDMSENEFTVLWEKRMQDMQASKLKKYLSGREPAPANATKAFPSDESNAMFGKLNDPDGEYIW